MDVGSVVIAIIVGVAFLALVLYVFGTLFAAPMEPIERVLWVVVILAFPFFGALIWLSWGQDSIKQRTLRAGQSAESDASATETHARTR